MLLAEGIIGECDWQKKSRCAIESSIGYLRFLLSLRTKNRRVRQPSSAVTLIQHLCFGRYLLKQKTRSGDLKCQYENQIPNNAIRNSTTTLFSARHIAVPSISYVVGLNCVVFDVVVICLMWAMTRSVAELDDGCERTSLNLEIIFSFKMSKIVQFGQQTYFSSWQPIFPLGACQQRQCHGHTETRRRTKKFETAVKNTIFVVPVPIRIAPYKYLRRKNDVRAYAINTRQS